VLSTKEHALRAIQLLDALEGDSVLLLTSEVYNTLGICENNQENYPKAIT